MREKGENGTIEKNAESGSCALEKLQEENHECTHYIAV